jgi:hypothetical protein
MVFLATQAALFVNEAVSFFKDERAYAMSSLAGQQARSGRSNKNSH